MYKTKELKINTYQNKTLEQQVKDEIERKGLKHFKMNLLILKEILRNK